MDISVQLSGRHDFVSRKIRPAFHRLEGGEALHEFQRWPPPHLRIARQRRDLGIRLALSGKPCEMTAGISIGEDRPIVRKIFSLPFAHPEGYQTVPRSEPRLHHGLRALRTVACRSAPESWSLLLE